MITVPTHDLKRLILMQDNPCPNQDGDGLRLGDVADLVAGATIGNEGPFTIGVFGPWGVGKTSLLNLAQQMVDDFDQEATVTVRFNAWQHERETEPLFALIAAVIEAIKAREKKLNKAAKAALNFIVGTAYALMVALKGKVELGIEGGPKLGADFDNAKFFETIQEWMKDENVLSQELVYTEAYKLLSEKSNEGHFKIVVFIDDLDRCDPEHAVHLLESIKLILNQRGFVFVLALADNVVTKYLQNVYIEKFKLDTTKAWGEHYLEKIVNLPVRIPDHRDTFGAYAQHQIATLAAKHVIVKTKSKEESGLADERKKAADILFPTQPKKQNRTGVHEAEPKTYPVEVRTLATVCEPLASGAGRNPRQFVRLSNSYLTKTRLWQNTQKEFVASDPLLIVTDVILEMRLGIDDVTTLATDDALCESIFARLAEPPGSNVAKRYPNPIVGTDDPNEQADEDKVAKPNPTQLLEERVLSLLQHPDFAPLKSALLEQNLDNWFVNPQKRNLVRYLAVSQSAVGQPIDLHPAIAARVRRQLSLDENEPVTNLHCREVKELDLRISGLSAGDLLPITRSFPNLTTLHLAGNQIGNESATAIAQSQTLKDLTTLDLGENQIGNKGVIAIAQSQTLKNLTTLNLGSNQIGNEGAAAIAQSPNLKHLKELWIQGNRLSQTTLALIRRELPDTTII